MHGRLIVLMELGLDHKMNLENKVSLCVNFICYLKKALVFENQ